MLVELIVVLSLATIIGGAALMLTSRMLGAQHRMASSLVEYRTLSQLELQLRNDARNAGRIERVDGLDAAPWQLRFPSHDADPVYTFSADRVERHLGGQLAGRWTGWTGRWETTVDADGRRARLELLGTDAVVGEPPRTPRGRMIVVQRWELVTTNGRPHP
ncbi:MAG: hypothetical protein DWH91_07835 [Planctomycetota bacterium]|nr:MAG: hypothetical protein DWH91_07835 [Planctomycetota bacterium]